MIDKYKCIYNNNKKKKIEIRTQDLTSQTLGACRGPCLQGGGDEEAEPEAPDAEAQVQRQEHGDGQADAPVGDRVQDRGQRLPPRAAHHAWTA